MIFSKVKFPTLACGIALIGLVNAKDCRYAISKRILEDKKDFYIMLYKDGQNDNMYDKCLHMNQNTNNYRMNWVDCSPMATKRNLWFVEKLVGSEGMAIKNTKHSDRWFNMDEVSWNKIAYGDKDYYNVIKVADRKNPKDCSKYKLKSEIDHGGDDVFNKGYNNWWLNYKSGNEWKNNAKITEAHKNGEWLLFREARIYRVQSSDQYITALCHSGNPTFTEYFGYDCGDGKVEWMHMSTANRGSGCTWKRSDYANNSGWLNSWVGSCGVSPTAVKLPTTVSGPVSDYQYDVTHSINALSAEGGTVTTRYFGNDCGNGRIEWFYMETLGKVRDSGVGNWNRDDYVNNSGWLAEWVGSCGVSPTAVSLPTHSSALN